MPQTIASFNPASVPSGQFVNPLPGGIGTLVIYNDSGITIDAMWNSESQVLPAGMIDAIKICDPAQLVSWQQDYILTNVSSWPASVVKVVGYRPDEKLPYAAFPVPLQRTSNVGNSVPIATSATSVQNDGNAAPTQVVEGTPSGAPGSELLLNNDGSGKLGGGNIAISAAGAITGAAIDGSEITTGTVIGARIGSPLPLGTVIGSSTDGVSMQNAGGGTSGDAGIVASSGQAVSISSGTTPAYLKANNMWNGSHDIYNGSSFAAQLFHILGDTTPTVKVATSGTAGNNISWLNPFHLSAGSMFSGTGSGTYSHGLGSGTPGFVGITENVSNSTTTVGIDSLGSTTVHVNIFGGALAFVAGAFAV